jgi:hypothetical protein
MCTTCVTRDSRAYLRSATQNAPQTTLESGHDQAVLFKLIFYSFGAILTRFTLLEFAKIENVVQLLKGECIFVLIRKYCALRGVESTSARDVFPSQAR